MIDSINKMKKLRTVAQNPTESDLVQALCEIIATLEQRQLLAVNELHDALDVDGPEVGGTKDQRQAQLLSMVGAIAEGDFRSWWFSEVASRHIDHPEKAIAYAGLGRDSDEWREQIGRWAERYRESQGLDEFNDRQIAAKHVERKFGVPLAEFEREVVEYGRQEAIRQILAGRFERVERGISLAEAEARDAGGDEE